MNRSYSEIPEILLASTSIYIEKSIRGLIWICPIGRLGHYARVYY